MPAPVTFHYALRFSCEAEPGARVLLAVLPACTHHQQLVSEQLSVHGADARSVVTEAATATRYLRVTARGGRLDVELDARVRLLLAEPGGGLVRRDACGAMQWGESESLHFLLPSRWCPSDALVDLATREFLQIDRPYERMRAVERWVRRRVRLLPTRCAADPLPEAGASRTDPCDVREALGRGAGTATELAHLVIALCRAARLPARFVTTVPIGRPADALHPWVEVLVEDAWLALEPSRRMPRTGLMRLGTGRDAADVPVLIAHGDIADRAVVASLTPEQASLEALHERDRGIEAICAATLGSLGDATRWRQEARLAARHPETAVAEDARPAPSRIAAAAARAAVSAPRESGHAFIFAPGPSSRLTTSEGPVRSESN